MAARVWSSGYEACQRSLYSPTYGLTLIGKSDVAGGDVTSNFGSRDAWLLRLNDAGDILWQRSYGGTLLDEGKDLAPAPDGGLFAIAQTSSNNGQVQGNHGGYELWAFRLDATGEILWQRCIGGSGDEWPNRIIRAANGDWLISGFTYSNDGDISGYHSEGDAWLTRVSDDNQLVFSTVYGGSSGEGFGPLLELGDGSILVAGSTSSSDGDVSGQPPPPMLGY